MNATQLRNPTRSVPVGSVIIDAGHPIVIQRNAPRRRPTPRQRPRRPRPSSGLGAGIVRIAVDSRRDAGALRAIREKTGANLSVDLQENYRIAGDVRLGSTRFATTRAIYTTTSEIDRGRTRSATWSTWPASTVRGSRRRELRFGRSGEAGEVFGRRFDRANARKLPWTTATCSTNSVSPAIAYR